MVEYIEDGEEIKGQQPNPEENGNEFIEEQNEEDVEIMPSFFS